MLTLRIDLRGLDFNGLVRAISEASARACGELAGKVCRAVRRLYLEADGAWLRRQRGRRRRDAVPGDEMASRVRRGMLLYVGASYSHRR